MRLEADRFETRESVFENILMKLAKNAMDLVSSEMLRGREDICVDLIKEIVRYAAFTEGELGLNVEEAIGNQVFNIYESFDFADMDADDVDFNKELLKLSVGLSF
jgi:hypothetical protein